MLMHSLAHSIENLMAATITEFVRVISLSDEPITEQLVLLWGT